MKIGICQKDLQMHGSLAETLTWVSRQGFDGFQIWLYTIEREGLTPSRVKRMAADLDLEISALGGGLTLADPASTAKNVDRFRQLLETSVELGPGIVTTETGPVPDGVSGDEGWRTLVECVSGICDAAADVGAVLAVECANRCVIDGRETWLRLADEVGSDRLRVNLDPANLHLGGGDEVEAVRTFADRIVHTHAKDVVCTHGPGSAHPPGMHHDVAAGEGIVSYPEYLAALAGEGYSGFLTIEMHARGEDRRADVVRAAANLRRMVEGVTART